MKSEKMEGKTYKYNVEYSAKKHGRLNSVVPAKSMIGAYWTFRERLANKGYDLMEIFKIERVES